MYECLTKYLQELDNDEKGVWIFDKENDGSAEHPKQMPYVMYSRMVKTFIEDFYSFMDEHEEIGLNYYSYSDILKANDIEWKKDSMSTVVVDNLDAKCVLALIFGVIRAERFCDGALLSLFENGSIARWLKKLKELDTEQE